MPDQAGPPTLFAPLGGVARKLPRPVVLQAAQWMARLQCDDTAAARQACDRWRAADPDHECAWQRMNALARDLGTTRAYTDPRIASTALDQAAARDSRRNAIKLALPAGGLATVGSRAAGTAAPPWLAGHRTGTGEGLAPTPAVASTALDQAAGRDSRRNAIKLALLAGGLATVGWRAAGTAAPPWLAAHRTGTGERLALTLADGTRVVLNTRSAIDVDMTETVRQIWLRQGEILVTTARDEHRPLLVRTASGSLRPIGTQFTARQFND